MPDAGRDFLHPTVRALVDETVRTATSNRTVAFDADGTLWRGDIGEELLRYLAREDLLPHHRGRRGVYEEYERRVHRDPADAYAWAVEVMEGMEEAELEALCRDFFHRRFEGRLFPYVRALLDQLQAARFEIYLVSASPLWPVVAGARALGLRAEQVIAVDCAREDGRLSRPVVQPVPCGEGKVAWLRRRGVRPALAFGNGDLDLPMLAFAERAVVLAPPSGDNALTRAAQERGWPLQRC